MTKYMVIYVKNNNNNVGNLYTYQAFILDRPSFLLLSKQIHIIIQLVLIDRRELKFKSPLLQLLNYQKN